MNPNLKPKESPGDFGWHSRGYIPHFDGGEYSQFITLRLHDSMPQNVLEKWRSEVLNDADFRKRIETYLDAGYGRCWLKDERIASIVEDSLRHHDGKKFRLIAWVIMPNHVHFLAKPLKNEHLPNILHTLKSYTAHEINKILDRKGQFWQHESFDRYIRNEEHFANVVDYIENNPVKAGLCQTARDWRFGSAYFRSR